MKVLLLTKQLSNDYTFDRLYRTPLSNILGSTLEQFNQAQLYYPKDTKKVKADDKKEWLEDKQYILNQFDVILCSDGDYFKTMAGTAKAEGTIGLLYDSKYFKPKLMYVPSAQACTFHPDKHIPKLNLVFDKLKDYQQGTYKVIGEDIIHSYYHPMTVEDIKTGFSQLHKYPALTLDIEAKSLRFTEAGIWTIGFAWDQHNYICFPVDAIENQSKQVRLLLKEFIETYQGKLIVHKGNYDITVLNYVLFQDENITNIKGQVHGLNTFFGSDNQRIDDTLVITYLATNSCAGNTLGLKELASEFAGDWAVDVKDVTKVNLETLMTYNGIDCLSTWYIYNKYYPIMVQDEQEELYKTFMLPTLKANIRCQLNGLPIEPKEVEKFSASLTQEESQLTNRLLSYQEVQTAQWKLAEEATIKRNAKLKKKQTTIEENIEVFNFGSNKQLQVLVYEVMGLPVIERTITKEPAVGKKVLYTLINHTENQTYKNILQDLCDLADVRKIQSAFIPVFSNPVSQAGLNRICGFLNLAGTVSGRLSASEPNTQQLPASGSRFAKPVKKLFQSTTEWIFAGIDFNALEDRISALTTKDPEKLKVYTDNYDGHCLRAYSYFKDQMPDITEELNSTNSEEEKVEIINSIAHRYKHLRQDSKAPTFACTYGGTYLTLMKNCGFDEATAKSIEQSYHKLYVVSDNWVQEHIKCACEIGYIITGFGLKVRTPILANTIYSTNMPNLASAEARTAGNALGQGWGVLNDRAMNEVIDAIDTIGLTEDILPVNKIHDACYYLVRNDIDVILKLNELTTKAARWQDHPVIAHPDVHLSGQLDLFYPDWASPITLPEDCTEEQLLNIVKNIKD